MNIYDSVAEDEDLFVEDDEDIAEYLDEDIAEAFAEEEDEFSERRPRRRGRRPPRIRAGRTARGRAFFKPRPSRAPVSTSTLQASLERVGRDIRTNAAAIKRLSGQVKSATAKLNSVNNTQDKSISDLRKDLKTQSNAAQQQNQLNMLLPLLQKTPELEARPGQDVAAAPLLSSVQVKKQDTTLPLMLMMMASSQTGGAGASSMNMLLPLVLLLDK
jgi:hypothetical protein